MSAFLSARPWRLSRALRRAGVALAFLLLHPTAAMAQAPPALSLEEARAAARRHSPTLIAARELVNAARGLERQAGAGLNPVLSFSHEQASGDGQSTAQNIALLEQPLERGALRSARRDAARTRREAADARRAVAEASLDFDVTRAYALALAADRRAVLADQATTAFTEALRVSARRLAAGDLSGYANRRLKLEAARYAALRAEAILAQRVARTELASLVASSDDALNASSLLLTDSLGSRGPAPMEDSLLAVALRSRGELRAAELDALAATADARLATRERTPTPVLSGGLKTERIGVTGAPSQGLTGFVAGLSVPIPLWDRRGGAIEAADAESRRRAAEVAGLRRRIAREIADAYDAYRAADAQLAMLAPQLGGESRAALGAAQVAYAEGEITLVEWLDAVRAYREAEASFATLQADLLIRRAALERAVGAPLLPVILPLNPTPGDSPAPSTGLDR